MKEQIISKSYADALIKIEDEKGVDLVGEITEFNNLINNCNDLENLLFLELFTFDEKKLVLDELFKKTKISPMAKNFIYLLLGEKRLSLFPLIFKNLIVIDDHRKGFIKGTIEGSEDSIKESSHDVIKDFVSEKLQLKAILDYKQNKNITAGYMVTVEDLQLDASIDNQFELFKKSILGE